MAQKYQVVDRKSLYDKTNHKLTRVLISGMHSCYGITHHRDRSTISMVPIGSTTKTAR